MKAVRRKHAAIKEFSEPLPQSVHLAQIRLITGRRTDRPPAAVDLHIAPASQQKHLIDRKFHIGIITDIAVGNHRFGKCRFEQITCRAGLRLRSGRAPVRIPYSRRITENMDEIRILKRLVGRAFNPESQFRIFGFGVFVQLPEHLPLAPHESRKRNGMPVRRITAGIRCQA